MYAVAPAIYTILPQNKTAPPFKSYNHVQPRRCCCAPRVTLGPPNAHPPQQLLRARAAVAAVCRMQGAGKIALDGPLDLNG
jgi:hypothetical protein